MLDFDLFVYGTIGRRHELEAGKAGLRNDLYQRFLGEMAELVRVADQAGYSALGHPEHHLQIEGFEIIDELLSDIRIAVARKLLAVKAEGMRTRLAAPQPVRGASAHHSQVSVFAGGGPAGRSTGGEPASGGPATAVLSRPAAAQASEPSQATVRRTMPKVGRNDPCPCGSGKKFKHCHGA